MFCVCAADFGFRSDASAACVVGTDGRTFDLLDHLEMKPAKGAPLTPSVVVGAVATMARKHQCFEVWSDFHYSESIREELQKHRVQLRVGPAGNSGKLEQWTGAKVLIAEGRARIGNVPALAQQLKLVRAKPTQGGGLQIVQPRKQGSHGDLASAYVLALWAAANAIGATWPAGPLYTGGKSLPAEDSKSWLFRAHMGGDPFPDDDDEPRQGGKGWGGVF